MNLSSIRILYRQPDVLSLWGIPYNMRPGQTPRSILFPVFNREFLRYDMRPLGVPSDWIWLGSCGWFGHYDEDEIKKVKDFLALHWNNIPDGPHEWCRLTDP